MLLLLSSVNDISDQGSGTDDLAVAIKQCTTLLWLDVAGV